MVKFVYFLCFYFFILRSLEAAPIVDASMDALSNQAHFPLQGTVTITHDKEEQIDPQSFVMEGKRLEVSFVKDVKMSASSDTVISIYSFQLPATEKGLYVLPVISVKIADQTYHTTPSTYEVKEETAAQSASTPSLTEKSPAPVIFRLEASVQGPSTLYPGERTKLLYRISYNRSVDLTRTELPMIHPAHFQKVGDVQIRDYQLQDVTVQELIQEVEASELGVFSFGPSSIEGYAYTMQAGQKVYDPTLLKSETPIVTLQVNPLPQLDQPPSFTGALGQIKVEAHLTSSDSISVGDTLQLQIKVQGITNLSELTLPALQCQPGFSGFFQMSDLPPLAKVEDKIKFFEVELRPLTSLITQIPSIEVSSFDPTTNQYITQHTDPIPINVKSHALAPSSLFASIPVLAPIPSIEKWPVPFLSPLEIEEDIHPKINLTSTWLNRVTLLWMISLGILLLLLQKYWKIQCNKRPKPQIPKSEQLLKQALKMQNLHILEQAFWQRLWEKGVLSQNNFQLDKIPIVSVRTFLFELQALQYSEEKTFEVSQIKHTANQLFKAI